MKNPSVDAPAAPWWRVGMVWLVLSGPISVVVASLVTAVIAWKHIDPVLTPDRAPDAESAQPADLKNPLTSAERARNHAATPAGR